MRIRNNDWLHEELDHVKIILYSLIATLSKYVLSPSVRVIHWFTYVMCARDE